MSLADAFDAMKRPEPKVQRTAADPAPEKHIGKPIHLPLQGAAKSTHPDFESMKIYVRKATKKAAGRKWEDEGGEDLSSLVQHLLEKYLKGER